MGHSGDGTKWHWSFAGAVALTAATILAVGAGSASADGTVIAGNQNCADVVAGAQELKIDPPRDGTFNRGTFSVTVNVRTLGSDDPNHSGNQTGSSVVDFTVTGAVVVAVAVKGGPNTNLYDYRPGSVTTGTALHSPVNPNNLKFYGLSHISFCYVPAGTTVPPGVTPPGVTPPGVTPPGVTPPGTTTPGTQGTAPSTTGSAPGSTPPLVRGRAVLHGPTKCVGSSFKARVTGRRITRVRFYVDGKLVSTLTRANAPNSTWQRLINPNKFGSGKHQVVARVNFAAASQTRQVTRSFSFTRCARAVRDVNFTG